MWELFISKRYHEQIYVRIFMGTKPKLYTTTSISRDYNIFSVIIMYKCHKYHARKFSKSINRGNEKRKYKSIKVILGI